MATYTGDSLDKLRKQDLIPIVLSLQSKLEDFFFFFFIYIYIKILIYNITQIGR